MQIRNEKAKRYLSNMRKKPPVPFAHKFPNVNPLALRLLQLLLSFDPKDHPSTQEVPMLQNAKPIFLMNGWITGLETTRVVDIPISFRLTNKRSKW
ncbi:putative mitogen-activated protein kinase [Helianthus annuus]|nr:putative mitogen-activated protein kinase [Helianthus annuus]